MKRREMKLLLEERFERIALLETRIDTMDQLVEGYRAREQAILDTLQSTKENAARTIDQANTEAAKTRETAANEAKALIDEAASASEALRAEAERRAKEIMITAKAESDRMLRDAEIIKREYEEMVDLFNGMLEHNASELQTSAARFADFLKSSKIDSLDNHSDGEAFYKSVGALRDISLPDPSGDPALLMQNIYRIQKRPLPEEKMEQAAEERNAGARQGGDEPFSEAAWANEAQRSESEPQAEFTKAFDGAYNESAFVVRADGCHLTQAQAEHMFDALFAAPEFSANTDGAKNAPPPAEIPAAPAAGAPPAEGVRVFDELFQPDATPSGQLAQDEVPQSQAEGPEGSKPEPDAEKADQPADTGEQAAAGPVTGADAARVFDDFLSARYSAAGVDFSPKEPERAQPVPFSGAAWENEALPSPSEPQAEGTLFSSGQLGAAEPVNAATVSLDDAIRAIDAALAGYGGAAAVATAAPAQAEPIPESPEKSEVKSAPVPAAEEKVEIVEPSAIGPVSEEEAEHAFDDFIKHQADAFAPVQEPAAFQPAPYSEAAWNKGSFTGGQEPQAEGSLFQPGDEEDMQPAKAGMLDSDDTMREINDLLAGYAAQTPAFTEPAPEQAQPVTQPAPYSEAAWADPAAVGVFEPQAEGTLFSSEQGDAIEPVRVELDAANEEMRKIGDLLAEYKGLLTPSDEAMLTQTEQAAAQPEPYSAGAWLTGSFTSGHEPQAEGALFSLEEPKEAEPAEEEPLPAPRKYSDFGEVREWEPDREPDMDDIPTVSRYVGANGAEEEISLDQLLDEIIKAGE